MICCDVVRSHRIAAPLGRPGRVSTATKSQASNQASPDHSRSLQIRSDLLARLQRRDEAVEPQVLAVALGGVLRAGRHQRQAVVVSLLWSGVSQLRKGVSAPDTGVERQGARGPSPAPGRWREVLNDAQPANIAVLRTHGCSCSSVCCRRARQRHSTHLHNVRGVVDLEVLNNPHQANSITLRARGCSCVHAAPRHPPP